MFKEADLVSLTHCDRGQLFHVKNVISHILIFPPSLKSIEFVPWTSLVSEESLSYCYAVFHLGLHCFPKYAFRSFQHV